MSFVEQRRMAYQIFYISRGSIHSPVNLHARRRLRGWPRL
jgi:hypothetical protein